MLQELQKLIELHVTDSEAQLESGLTKYDHRMLMRVMKLPVQQFRSPVSLTNYEKNAAACRS